MPGNRAEDRADAPRIESGSAVRGGRQGREAGPAPARGQERHAPGARYKESEPERRRPPARGPGQERNSKRRNTLQNVLDKHRREMQLAAVSHRTAGTATAATESEAPPRPRTAPPPREAYTRDPKDPRSPARPSITTMTQQTSYGPQNFFRNDVIDKPRGGATLERGSAQMPMPAMAPAPARGAAAAADRARSGPSVER